MRDEVEDALSSQSVFLAYIMTGRYLHTLIGYQYAPDFAPSAACCRTRSTSAFAVSVTLADIVRFTRLYESE